MGYIQSVKKNKITLILSILSIIIIATSNIFVVKAEETEKNEENINKIIDIEEKEGLYKFSEGRDIYLPFFRMSYDKVEIDKEISNLGITYGNRGVDVNSKTQNIQVIASNDTIRVNENMEYAIILSRGNVIIDSTIDKTLVVFAGEKVTLTENAKVSGDVICFSNLLEIKGSVSGSVIGGMTDAIISGKIEKDFRAEADNVDISSNDNILGKIYIETLNKEINIKEKYGNASIKFIERASTSSKIIDILISAVKTALVYTLLYLLVFKISKEKIFNNLLKTTSKNFGFSVMSGAISYLAIPLVVLLAFLGIFIGIEEIMIPIMVFYLANIFVISLISIFIAGGVAHEYVIDSYFKDVDLTKRMVCVFFVFLSMILFTNIPKIGIYINMIIMIMAVGIIFSYIFKREESIKSKKKK